MFGIAPGFIILEGVPTANCRNKQLANKIKKAVRNNFFIN
jgi:hypothetical protein